jgi:ParB family chromosome partitioning protein
VESTKTTASGRKSDSLKTTYRDIPIEQLLEPARPARETMDEEKLTELIESIREVGLIEPLVVQPEGEYFRILAGHRRYICCKALGMARIPCVIRPLGPVDGEAIKDHENAFREDLNPAEQAKYYLALLEERCEGDVDKLCERVRRPRNFVEGRILLASGDAGVFEALSQGRIQIGVAVELNKVTDAGLRLVYLDAAVKGGASVALVREWRIKANSLYQEPLPTLADQPPAGILDMPAPHLKNECFFCQSPEHMYLMDLVYLHRYCREAIVNRLLGGQPTPER